MRIVRLVLVVLACVMQTACLTQREALPPSTRAELLRLGRIITDENEAEETRYNSRILYRDLLWESIQKYGKKSVDRQTVIDSFMVNGQKPKGLRIDDGMLDYEFESKDQTFPAVLIYFGGWTGSYVDAIYLVTGIP